MTSLRYAVPGTVTKAYAVQPGIAGAVRALFRTSAFLYVLSACVGVWAAYNRPDALVRFGWLAAGVLCALLAPRLVAGARRLDPANRLGQLSAVAAALLGGVYLLYRFDIASVPHAIDSAGLHDNTVAGALVVLLPLGAGSALYSWHARNRAAPVAVLGLLALGAAALLFTGSRGAMVGLASGVFIALYAAWRTRRRRSPSVTVVDLAVAVAVLGSLAAYATVVGTSLLDQRLGIQAWGGSPASRIVLWRDTFPLIGDYVYTGSGLSGTDMVYSSYVFLLHVPYFYHAHNLYLQIAVEQAVVGVAGFIGMMAAGIWALWIGLARLPEAARSLAIGALVALVAMLVHGLFDAELYVSPLAILLFVPLVLAGVLLAYVRSDDATWTARTVDRPRSAAGVYGAVGVAVLLVAVFIVLWPPARAALEANLGAVSQTQAELSVYEWPEWPIQDEVRRTSPYRLEPALAWYERALRTDPANVTANRRLGQIELSLSEYEAALAHLETAFAPAPDQRATRQMLGEAYAVTGDAARAWQLWQTVDTSAGQLDLRRWWYEHIGIEQEWQE